MPTLTISKPIRHPRASKEAKEMSKPTLKTKAPLSASKSSNTKLNENSKSFMPKFLQNRTPVSK